MPACRRWLAAAFDLCKQASQQPGQCMLPATAMLACTGQPRPPLVQCAQARLSCRGTAQGCPAWGTVVQHAEGEWPGLPPVFCWVRLLASEFRRQAPMPTNVPPSTHRCPHADAHVLRLQACLDHPQRVGDQHGRRACAAGGHASWLAAGAGTQCARSLGCSADRAAALPIPAPPFRRGPQAPPCPRACAPAHLRRPPLPCAPLRSCSTAVPPGCQWPA